MLSPSESKVYFFFNNYKITLKNRQKLKEFILSVFKTEGKQPGTVNYIFSSDKVMFDINRRYLKHAFPTDIITFDLSTDKNEINADIYLSPVRIKSNAKDIGVSFKSELHRVILHGVLHLCGYKDRSEEDKRVMRKKEDYYLNVFLKRNSF
jgi:probable rRNA maturation factor